MVTLFHRRKVIPLSVSHCTVLSFVTLYLEPGDWGKGQLGDDSSVEDGVEHGEKGGERETDSEHRLHLDHHLKN
jgi:hypothetical protein